MRPILKEDLLITPSEVMQLLCIGKTTLRKFCRLGKLNPIYLSKRSRRFRLSEIQAFIDNATKGGTK
jgi:predicted site-specific integrase-resolvase